MSSVLMFTARKHFLLSQQYALQSRLQELTRKLYALQNYSATIADGSVSVYDMADVSPELRQRALMFATESHKRASFAAANDANFTLAQMQGTNPNAANLPPEQLNQYFATLYDGYYKQEREKLGQLEAKVLNQQEKAIAQEKDKVETKLRMIEKEYERCEKAEEKGLESFAPKYVA